MKHQCLASSVSRSSISSDFPSVACFRCRMPKMRVVGSAITVSQHPFDVGFTVEDFAAQLDVGYPPLVTVILKCLAAYLQPCRHLLVGEDSDDSDLRQNHQSKGE